MKKLIRIFIIQILFLSSLIIGCKTGEVSTQNKPQIDKKQKQYNDQIAALKQRINTDPKDVNAYAQLGYIYGQKGDVKQEIHYYEQAVAIYPQYKEVYYNLACAYSDIGNKDKAFQALEMSLVNGFRSRSLLESDTDLRALRSDPKFNELVEKYFGKDSKSK